MLEQAKQRLQQSWQQQPPANMSERLRRQLHTCSMQLCAGPRDGMGHCLVFGNSIYDL
jgi:hypothetical protein